MQDVRSEAHDVRERDRIRVICGASCSSQPGPACELAVQYFRYLVLSCPPVQMPPKKFITKKKRAIGRTRRSKIVQKVLKAKRESEQQTESDNMIGPLATIGILSIGSMGAGVARLLSAHNYRVVTNASDRR